MGHLSVVCIAVENILILINSSLKEHNEGLGLKIRPALCVVLCTAWILGYVVAFRMVFISHNLNLTVVKLPPLNCLNQSDRFFLLSLSVMTRCTACLPCKTVCLHVLYVRVDVCVLTQNGFSQQNVCVCVCVWTWFVCSYFEANGNWWLHVALSSNFTFPHTHTCTSQYTLKNTHNHESLHKYTNTVHTPSLSWHQSRLADFFKQYQWN